jgi:hypothetical protein
LIIRLKTAGFGVSSGIIASAHHPAVTLEQKHCVVMQMHLTDAKRLDY